MSTEAISYSPVPALQALVAKEDPDDSRLEILCDNLLKAQMNLSRVNMYGKDGNTDLIHYAMSVIADVYDEFQHIEASRRKYVEAMQHLE